MKYPMVCYECRTNLVCRCFKQPRTEWHSREEAAGSAAFHGWEAIGGLSYCPKCKLKGAE